MAQMFTSKLMETYELISKSLPMLVIFSEAVLNLRHFLEVKMTTMAPALFVWQSPLVCMFL